MFNISDGTVKIKVQANDQALDDLVSGIRELTQLLNNLPSNPLQSIGQSASNARDALLGVSDMTAELTHTLDQIDSSGVDNVAESANQADGELQEMSFTANDVDQNISNIDSRAIDELGSSADSADADLEDLSFTAMDVESNVSDIDSRAIEDLGNQADRSEGDLQDLAFAADDLEDSVSNVNSDSIDALGSSADQAESDMQDLSFAASDVDGDISNIDSRPLEDIGRSADRSEGDVSNLGDSASDTARLVDEINADSVQDIGDSAERSSAELGELGNSAGQAADEVSSIEPSSIQETERSSDRLEWSLRNVGKTAVLVKALSATFDMLTSSIDGAIDRFDTFNTFPRTMEGLGHSTEQADRAMRRLDEGTRGLPTTLDSIVQNVQRIASVTGDLNLATETALALNNAFLASGSSAADAARGTEQYVQMLSRGEADLQSYRTLQETMTLALNQTAESFGFAGESAQTDFYAALQSGEITFREFNARLIEMSEAQDGFADLAQTNSESLRTSWTNLSTAFVRNTANMIQKLDEFSYALTDRSIAQNVDRMQGAVNTAFDAMGAAMDAVFPIIETTVNGFTMLYNATQPLHPAIMALAASIATMRILNSLTNWLGMTEAGIAAYVFWTDKMNAATLKKIAIQKANLAWAKAAVIQNALVTGSLGAKTIAIGAATKAWGLLSGAITLLTGPVGWVIGAIGAVAGGLVWLYNTLGQATPEMEAMTEELEDAAEASSSLSDSIESAAESYESSQARIEGQTNSLETLAEETRRLSELEQLSAGDKKLLQDNIEELNASVEGLNLTYDEEQGRLTASNEAMDARLAMMEEENNMAAQRERLNEIEQQRAEATALLEENSRKLNDAQVLLEESGVNWFGRNSDLKESIEGLREENTSLTETLNFLGEEEERVNAQRTESVEAYAEAAEVSNNQAITSLEELSEKQREVAENIQSEYQGLVESARDWSNEIEAEYTKTNEAGEEYVASSEEVFADAKRTLESNVEAMQEWADNMEKLSKRGIDEGMLEQLRQMGPEGLPLVEGFVNASDAELAEMEILYAEAGEHSKDGLLNGLALEDDAMIDGAEGLIFNTQETMIEAVESSGLANVVPDALEESAGDMEEAGRSIAQGAASGISDGAGDASEASESMAYDINDRFRSTLGINSPSRVFTEHGADIVRGLLNGFNQAKPQMLQAVTQLASEINSTFQDSLHQMNAGSMSGWQTFADTIADAMRQANNTVRQESNAMLMTIESTNDRMNQVAMNGTRQMSQMYQQSYRQMNQTATREFRSMQQTTQRSVQQQQTIVQRGYMAMRQQIQSNLTGAVAVTRSTMNQALAIMQNTASGATAAGRGMGNGFRNGLASTAGSIQATARNIANSASNTMRSALQINSPSRVTTELGEFTGDGLVEGMKNRVRDVEAIAEDMAARALPQIDVARSLGSIGGAAQSSGAVYNNQSYTLNANGSGGATQLSREEMQRLFREFVFYIQQEGGALDG